MYGNRKKPSELAKACERVRLEYSPTELSNLLQARQGNSDVVLENERILLDADEFGAAPSDSFGELRQEDEALLNKVCAGSLRPGAVASSLNPSPSDITIPDDVQTVLHAAYFFEMKYYLSQDYVDIIQAPENLTLKAMVYSTVEAVFKANQLPIGSRAKKRAIEPLTGLLISRHGCIERLIHEVPDETRLSDETYAAFINYAEEIKVGVVMPDYKTQLRDMTKKDFMNILALKFFYDSMKHVRNKKQGRIKRIRKIDSHVNVTVRAGMNHLGIKKVNENYFSALREFIFDTPNLTFMSPKVHAQFEPLVPQDKNL
ncbi:MAG: hypothetical protein KAT77_03810 [Nanoarchaeota archaeon]|nr:hypothetical protein [Nanoarchaeota archaeon]